MSKNKAETRTTELAWSLDVLSFMLFGTSVGGSVYLKLTQLGPLGFPEGYSGNLTSPVAFVLSYCLEYAMSRSAVNVHKQHS